MPQRPAPSLLALSVLALLPAGALAGPLPLARGTYVLRGTPCEDAPFAAMRSYDGVGLGDPHSHDCRIRRVTRSGERYRIDNDCIGVGVGPGPRSIERLSLRLGPTSHAGGAARFTILAAGRTSAYRLCPTPAG